MIRSWVGNIFESFLNVAFILSAIGIVIFSLVGGMAAGSGIYGSVASGLFTAFIGLISGAIGLIITFGLIYAVLDIRASLKAIEKQGNYISPREP